MSVFAALGIWSNQLWRAKRNHVYGFSNRHHIQQLRAAARESYKYAQHVKSLLRLEKAAWLDEQAGLLSSQFKKSDMQGVHHCVKSVLTFSSSKSKQHKNHLVCNNQGVCAQSYPQERQR